MKENISRKEFLLNASKAAIGVTGIAAVSSLVTTATANASTKVTQWPWPYKALDVDNVRIQAHKLYWGGMDCCSGVFGALVNELNLEFTNDSENPWANMPVEIMLFGRGGGAGWGSLCGAINGASALISLVVNKADSGNLINELWGWYSQAELPTTTANEFATSNKYLVHEYDSALIQNISGSPLCHVSVTEWCIAATKKVGDKERKERCARVAGDCAAKTAELLNAYFANSFEPTYVDPAGVAGCLACHGAKGMNNVLTKLDCAPCHGNPHATSKVQELSQSATSFKLEQNYPNPFNPSTTIEFSVPVTEKVRIDIYDIKGSLVKTLVDYDVYQPGSYRVDWNGRDNNGAIVSSGVYFTKMQSGKFVQTKKMSFIK